jgi:Family of unknown function (DUF6522)
MTTSTRIGQRRQPEGLCCSGRLDQVLGIDRRMGRLEDRSGSAYIEQTPYTGSPTDERADECDDAGVRLVTKIEFGDRAVLIDASILGEGLGLEASLVPVLMRKGAITSLCERGIDADAGRFRMTFFYKSRRLRLVVDAAGNILQRSTIDFGDRPLPDALRIPASTRHRSTG